MHLSTADLTGAEPLAIHHIKDAKTARQKFLPEVTEFITRHTAYNKHDTGWAEGAPSEDHTTPALPHRPPGGPLAAVGLLGGRPQAPARFGGG